MLPDQSRTNKMRRSLIALIAGIAFGCAHAPKNTVPDWVGKETYYRADGEFMFAVGKSREPNPYYAKENATTNAILTAKDTFDRNKNAYEKKARAYHQCSPWASWSNGAETYSLVRCDAHKPGKESFQQVIKQ